MKLKSDTYPPLETGKLLKVANGKNRDIYLVPDPSSATGTVARQLVLKVPRYGNRQDTQLPLKKALQSIAPSSRQRAIQKEVAYLERLRKRTAALGVELPIPQFFGFVDTDVGKGTLWEAICDETGSLAPTLRLLKGSSAFSQTVEPLNRFVNVCFDHNIVAPDIKDNNLILTQRDGRDEIILVDGFGDHRMISLRGMWPPLNARSLVDRFNKLARQTGFKFDQTERRFLPPS